MDLEQQTENYLHQLLDRANSLDIEPHFVDELVCGLMNTNNLAEDVFLAGYFIRLANAFIADSQTGLKSYRPELVQCSRLALRELNEQELQELPIEDYKIIYWNLGHAGNSDRIRQTHVVSLAMARNDIEEQKVRYGMQDFTSLVRKIFWPQIESLVPQRKQIQSNLFDIVIRLLRRPKG